MRQRPRVAGRWSLVALNPTGTGVMLETLHDEEEIRKSAPFDAAVFKDNCRASLRDLIDEKLASKGKRVATLPDTIPAGDDWLFELKYDGYRCIAAIERLHALAV